ncbi:ion channel DMI1 isoform X1 [Tanacetum coccineum]
MGSTTMGAKKGEESELVSDAISEKVDSLRKRKSEVIESDHILVLGWSDKLGSLLKQPAIANKSVGGGVVVVLAERDKEEMEMDIAKLEFSFMGTSIICRSGSPLILADLKKNLVSKVRAIIVLAADENADQSDARALRVMLSLTGVKEGLRGHVVVEMSDLDNEPLAKLVGGELIEIVVAHDVIGQLMIQCALQPGLAQIWEDILGFENAEFYIKRWPKLDGMRFEDVLVSFPDAIPCGVKVALKGGKININPSDEYILRESDEIRVIAEDDDTYSPGPLPEVRSGIFPKKFEPPKYAAKILFCGWRRDIDDMIMVPWTNEHLLENIELNAIIGACSEWRDLKRAQEASKDIISNLKSQIFVTEDCDDGSRSEENLVSDAEIVKIPTQPATTEKSSEDGGVSSLVRCELTESVWIRSGIRRSGRLKCKGPIIEENSIDEAIDVDEYLSDENGSDYSGEMRVISQRKVHHFRNNSPRAFFNAISKLSPIQKSCLEQLGFGKLLHFKVEGIPSKLGFYVVNNFDETTMEIKLENASLLITMESIADMIGISNEGVDIFAEHVVKDAQMIKNWEDQFGGIKNINANHVKRMIRNSRVADMNFKLNFIVLFTSVMGCVKSKGICDLSVLNHIRMDTDLAKVNWCSYCWRCLKKCKDGWKNTVTNSFFLGPITLLTMMYVDGTLCKDFIVERKRPPIIMWTKELLKERELAEIKCGGLGTGELAGPYLEEQDDPMPDNLEGFIWKLNNYVVCINKERSGFERTFDAAKVMFSGNTTLDELKKRFIESLKYKEEENADIGRESVHTEDETMENEGREQGMEANEVREQGMEPGERTGRGLDSPRYQLGPQTQAIVCETADKLYKESERKKMMDFSDIPSFSLGLTQEEYDMEADREDVNIYDREENRVKARQDPLEVVPLNFFSPTNEVIVRGRRAVTLTDRIKSPFYVRVVNADKVENSEEKQLANFLFNKRDGDDR